VLYAAPQNTTTIYAKDPVNGLVISVDNNVNVVTPTAAAHAYMTQDAWHVVLVRGPALEVRIDGVTTTGTTSTSDLSAVGTSISLGPTAGSPLMATIEYLHFLVYQGGMSDAQAAGLESHLKTEYGL
jgi:hypothetical protein